MVVMKDNGLKRTQIVSLFRRGVLLAFMSSLAAGTAVGALEPSGMSLAMFKAGLVTEPTVFKVEVKVASDSYAYAGFGESNFDVRTQFWAVYARPLKSRGNMGGERLTCLVKKDTSAGQTVAESLKDGAYHAALVSLRYSKNEKLRNVCVLDEIEMAVADVPSELTGKFQSTRIAIVKGREYHYVQGKIGLTLRTARKFFKKPVLRVVLLTEENGARVVRDCIIDEPNLKMTSSSDSIGNYTTTNGNDNNEPYERRFIEEVSAGQSEVSREKYGNLTYVGVPLDYQERRRLSGYYKRVPVFGYARFDKDEKATMLGYRVELWYNGACVSVFDTVKASQLSRLQIPDDWHVSFKYPEKFKYRAPRSNKDVTR